MTWRDVLVRYNKESSENALALRSAYQLYANYTYQALVAKFGMGKIYILSAGWGLIAASFMTPHYDVTFAANAESWKRRKKNEPYSDFSMLPTDPEEQLLFLGGKDYVPLFSQLTKLVRPTRMVFYNSACPTRSAGLPACEIRDKHSHQLAL